MPRNGSGASTRAPPMRTPPREPASSMVMPSPPARSSACRRETAGSRSGTSTARSRPRQAGSSATRHHGPPATRRLMPRLPIRPRGDPRDARLHRRGFLHARLRHLGRGGDGGAALAAGQQRFEAADSVDGVAAGGRAAARRAPAPPPCGRCRPSRPRRARPAVRRPAPRRPARRAGCRPRPRATPPRGSACGVPARSAAAGCCAR